MRLTLLSIVLLFFYQVTKAQLTTTANDVVKPYTAHFGYGSNVGYYPLYSAEQLGDLAMGNPSTQVMGAGITTVRPALFEYFQEQWGYELRVKTFEHYKKLGAKDNVVFVGYPSEAHRDTTYYCDSIRSELFLNMYTPIWDDGANGTPYNDENYYAAYLYKTVTLYKEYVKFWEIWNEPDYSFSANSIYAPGTGKNWWEHNPNPCEYDIHAPIFQYIRLLRISYEVIKTIDPEAYVAIGGIGYPSFLDAVLRNTDNMDEGKVTGDYPLKGGAYFDVLSYHVYPHIDGSLRSWSNLLKGFIYKRHSDAAAYGVLDLKNELEEVLFQHGYNGQTFPEKVWIITESNVPRKPLNQGFGTDEAQRNFIIKALVECQKNDIHQFHIFTLGDKMNFNDAERLYEEYNLMGIYGNLLQTPYKSAKLNDVGIAYKTTSDLLQKKRFDDAAYQRLELAKGVNGGVFKDEKGQQTIVLWAETRADNSESALQVINLRNVLGANKLVKKEWNYAITKDSSIVDARYVTLTGAPIFLTKLENSTYTGGGNPANPYLWEVFPNPFTSQVTINFEVQVQERLTLTIYDHIGRPKQVLVDHQVLSPGNYSWKLDGETFMSGIYFLEYKTDIKTKKILLIKSL